MNQEISWIRCEKGHLGIIDGGKVGTQVLAFLGVKFRKILTIKKITSTEPKVKIAKRTKFFSV